jgi:hypothetical protein
MEEHFQERHCFSEEWKNIVESVTPSLKDGRTFLRASLLLLRWKNIFRSVTASLKNGRTLLRASPLL